jgi:hypothetical protein
MRVSRIDYHRTVRSGIRSTFQLDLLRFSERALRLASGDSEAEKSAIGSGMKSVKGTPAERNFTSASARNAPIAFFA